MPHKLSMLIRQLLGSDQVVSSAIDKEAVVSPQQIEALTKLVSELTRRRMEFDVSTHYGDTLVEPFDVLFEIKTPDLSIWLYPDGADSSGTLNFRAEREDYPSIDELFEDLLIKVANHLNSALE